MLSLCGQVPEQVECFGVLHILPSDLTFGLSTLNLFVLRQRNS